MSAITGAILAAAIAYDLDPQLLTAIAQVESGMNPQAVGRSHGEIGLFQLRPEFHPCWSFDVEENTFCAASYLASIKRRHAKRFPKAWFVFYNFGINAKLKAPRQTAYYAKVMEAM